jgi:hypothetical protein
VEGITDVRRYLLGQMSEGEEARVERGYLGSDEALEELRAHEDELIEDYLAGALEPAERDRFERVFLASPVRLERMLFVRSLQDRSAGPLAGSPAGSPPPRAWVRAAAAALAVAAVGLLVVRSLGTRKAVEEGPTRTAVATPSPALPQAPTPPPPPVSFRLREPSVRGDGSFPLLDPGPAGQVALEVRLDPRDRFSAHRGRVVAPDGQDAFVSPWQPNHGEAALRVVLPASALREGRHVLVVEGRAGTSEEPVESYAFRVRRR